MNQAQRTQVYLPKELREEIDMVRRQNGESLAGYMRKAVEQRIKKDKKEKTDLKKLAKEVVGAVDLEKSGWEGIDIIKWQSEMRKDRKIF